ncbi:galactonate dehydratase [Halorarum halobium]|uniref:galactonate dehydratase n=1 Tax=Halorarum halobium TaxID=3075121 RepID=UPI0028AE597B|nr:galactonate dehydratase [Halobaculum sp. XH14]
MHITDYAVYAVEPRWVFLKLTTSDGHVGWGEAVGLGGYDTVTEAMEKLLDSYLVGENPARIEDHWSTMYRGGFYRGGPVLMAAIAGIDQALWDLKGKALGAPVHDLLGGRARDRIRVYAWIGGDRPGEVAEAARERVEDGFTALKMNATSELRRIDAAAEVEAARDRVAAVRDEIGPERDIALDFHGRVAKPMAPRLAAAVDEYDPLWLEEPVLPEHEEALPSVAAKTTAPIATGERLFSRWEFKRLFEQGAVDVIQPDLSHAGGITEVKKIASMAEAYDVALAPHCPLGPIALAACLQLDACTPNALIQEQSLHIHYNEGAELRDYLADPSALAYEDGYVEIPDGPGLGIELDEDAFRPLDTTNDPDASVWRHPDGSVAEW